MGKSILAIFQGDMMKYLWTTHAHRKKATVRHIYMPTHTRMCSKQTVRPRVENKKSCVLCLDSVWGWKNGQHECFGCEIIEVIGRDAFSKHEISLSRQRTEREREKGSAKECPVKVF